MYGQMTAGSWIYIGTQGIVQGTYETFAEAGHKHYAGSREMDPHRGARRHGRGATSCGRWPAPRAWRWNATRPGSISGCGQDTSTRKRNLDEALAMIAEWTANGEAKSVGLLGNAADVFPELVRRNGGPARYRNGPESAHDPLNGYLPQGGTWPMADERESEPDGSRKGRARVDANTRGRDGRLLDAGVRRSTTATTSVRLRWRKAWTTPLRSRASSRLIFGRCSVGESGPSAGFAFGRSRGHLQDGRGHEEAVPGQRPSASLARYGSGPDRLPGTARADLLDRPRGSPPRRADVQRDGEKR